VFAKPEWALRAVSISHKATHLSSTRVTEVDIVLQQALKEMAKLHGQGQKVGAFLYATNLAETYWFKSLTNMESYIHREIQSGMTLVGIIFYSHDRQQTAPVLIKKYGNFPEGSPEHRAIKERANLLGPNRIVSAEEQYDRGSQTEGEARSWP